MIKTRPSFNAKYYTTDNNYFTDKHNKIMERLLFAYFLTSNDIEYDELTGDYVPLNREGANLLEHLVNCDLISVVAD